MQSWLWHARLLSGFATLLATSASPALAQSDSAGPPSAKAAPAVARVCWRGKPIPRCSAFWITELGYDFVNSTTKTVYTVEDPFAGELTFTGEDFGSRLTWTVGPMFNTDAAHAIGGTLSISPVNDGARAALEGRRRWWLKGGNAVDVSAGLLRAKLANGYPARTEWGLTAGGYVVGGDYVNVNGRVDFLVTGGRQRLGTSAGIGVGSQLAAGSTVLLGLLVLAAFAIIAQEGGAY